MHRLVAYAHNGVQRFTIDRSELLIGSGDQCDIKLPYAGVVAEHARLHSGGDRLEILDLGSRKGVLVNGRRVREARLEVLDEIRLGSIALLVEDITEAPRVTAVGGEEPTPAPVVIDPVRMLEHLARVSEWVLADSASSTSLESLVIELIHDFGGGVLFLFQGDQESRSIKFVVASEAKWLGCGQELLDQLASGGEEGPSTALHGRLDGGEAWVAAHAFRALERPHELVAAFPRFRLAEWSPLPALRTLGDLLILGLVHHVGQFEPILLSLQSQAELTLAPGLVVGQSAAMQRVLEQLKAAVEAPVHVLLRGEAGVSKELLARSLHLSSPKQHGPFVTATCSGAHAERIEAELFGAELAGKKDSMVRDGKLLLADQGTLFLEDVETLPLTVQDRLVRFLRTGMVEPAGSSLAHQVDVRLITTSAAPLEAFAARDQVRLDLAYQLSQYAVDVPALRDRREDLPMLIQAAVNRTCHETGKRIQGITVAALEALAVYDYPGNLPELENIVRRLVYLCPSGRPIDESMLPEELRLAKIRGPRPEDCADLSLERLVSDTERAAIREALRRGEGNKSEAARQLGLSRNGLNMKIKRLGLQT